jgi:hypothetical protein
MEKFICTIEGKNNINIYTDHAEIIIPQGVVLVDLDDVDKCSSHKWTIDGDIVRDSQHTVSLGRLILNVTGRKRIRYRNNNTMDCRKANLYTSDTEEPEDVSSKHIVRTNNGFYALIDYDGELLNLGRFDSEEEAEQAYNDKVAEIYREVDPLGLYK